MQYDSGDSNSQSRQWWLLMAWRQAGHQKTFITVGDIACVDFIRSSRRNVGRWLLMLGVHLITRGPMGLFHTVQSINHWWKLALRYQPMRKNCHRKLTVSSLWPRWSRLRAQWSRLSRRRGHGEVTAQSWLGHSSVTARSQLNHSILSMITAQSRLGHSSITAQVMAQSWLAVTILVTASSRWVHCELTMSSHGGQFFFSSEYLINI